VLLLFVCIVIPWRITFIENETSGWYWSFLGIDFIFLIDMVITFFTSITDNEKLQEETDKKIIAKNYFSGWFWIDLVSIFPFDEFTTFVTNLGVDHVDTGEHGGQHNPQANVMLRTIKLGKLGKMIRLMRLLKVFKIMKNSQNLKSHFNKKIQLDSGIERLFGIFLQFFFANHVFALFWVIIGEN
jgi:hypothetical protein